MQMKKLRVILILCPLLLISLMMTQPINASYLNDSLNDVWSENSATTGDFTDYIDIQQVVNQGSSIMITVEGSLTTIKEPAYFLVLLSDDGDPKSFEAAIIFSFSGDEQGAVYWTIGNPLADSGVSWDSDFVGKHSFFEKNLLKLNFLEYDSISYSELVVATLITEEGNRYFDWSPNAYDMSFFSSLFPKIILNLPTGAIPPLTPTPTTSSLNSTPTNVLTTTEERTTGGLNGIPTSGFSLIPVFFVILSVVIVIKKRSSK